MSNINRHNYEAFLLDYIEQNLSPNMVEELMLFLEQNTDLKEAFDELHAFEVLEPASVHFENKTTLKKQALDNLMIAEMEGLTTSQESKVLEQVLQTNKVAKNDFKLFQQTKLLPNQITFKNKKALKKEAIIIPLRWWTNAAAAVLIIAILIQGLDEGTSVDNQFQIATFKPVILSKEEVAIKKEIEPSEGSVNKQLTTSKKNRTITEKIITTPDKKINTIEQLVVKSIVEQDSIVILPTVLKKEDKLLANNITEHTPVLTITGFLKKEAFKKMYADENTLTKQPIEILVADLVSKVAGKNSEVKKKKNTEGEVKEYALSIGKFSISRKVKD